MFHKVDPEEEQSRAGVLRTWLGAVAFYCEQEDLPALTVLVVNSETGKPGHGFPLRSTKYVKDLDELREDVYSYDWYDLHPPTPKELLEAWHKAT